MNISKKSFLRNNALSIVFILLAVLTLAGQSFTGWLEYNEHLQESGMPPVNYVAYLFSGHFLQSTFENWESEFLQMALFVMLTACLVQRGSSESKAPEDPAFDSRDLRANRYSPWPVKRGGLWLSLYKYSLSLALLVLFLASFILHWYGSWKDYNLNQALEHMPECSFTGYLGNKRFWFESLQNWQSEFLSVFVIVYFSIYLRQWGSPQSKPVNMAHQKNKPE